jgi:anti-anti-sigma regulatory factor
MAAVHAVHPVTLLPRLGALHAAVTPDGVTLSGDSDLATRAEFDAALGKLACLPPAALVIDITGLSFLDAHSAGAVLRLAAGLAPPGRLEVRCRSTHRRLLHLLGARSLRQLSISTERL